MRLRNVACFACFATTAALVMSQPSCSSRVTATTVDSGAVPDVITVGVSNSLTGGLSSIGVPLHRAWSVAETYLNDQGGVLGKRIAFTEIDDETDSQSASDDGGFVYGVARQLIGLKVAAVIGPNGSSQVQAVNGLFFANQMLQVTPSATSTTLPGFQPTDGGRFLFRTVPSDAIQGKALAKLASVGPAQYVGPDGGPSGTEGVHASDVGDGGDEAGDDASTTSDASPTSDAAPAPTTIGCHNVALVYFDDTYGLPMEAVFEQHYTGGNIATRVQLQDTLKSDYSTEVQKVFNAAPDCLAMIVYDDVADAFLRQLRSLYGGTIPFPVMGTDGLYDSKFVTAGLASPNESVEDSVAEGTYGTNPDTNPPDSPEYQFFKSLYTTQYPLASDESDIEAYASNEFDAAMLIALAIEKAGGLDDRVKLRDSFVAISNGLGEPYGARDFASMVHFIRNGTSVGYAGASGPCVIDPTTGDVSGAGYIVWHVEHGRFVTLKHFNQSDL